MSSGGLSSKEKARRELTHYAKGLKHAVPERWGYAQGIKWDESGGKISCTKCGAAFAIVYLGKTGPKGGHHYEFSPEKSSNSRCTG